MIPAERIVYSFLFFLIAILFFLYANLMAEKIRELLLEKKKEGLLKELSPLIDKTFEKLSHGKAPGEEIRLLKKRAKIPLQRELISEKIISYSELVEGRVKEELGQLAEALGLVDYELKNLKTKSIPARALACRRLGEYRSRKALPALLKALALPSLDVKFQALEALAKIGDLEYFLKAFLEPYGVQLFSERSLIEIIDGFEGDKEAMYKKMISHEDDYLASVFIKSAGNGRFVGVASELLENLYSPSFMRKIAAVKALGQIAAPEFTHSLIGELKNPDWRIRAVTAKALGEAQNTAALPALKEAVGDENWWVRYNAARAIIKMGNYKDLVQEIFSGEDPFAKDMLRYVLKTAEQKAGHP